MVPSSNSISNRYASPLGLLLFISPIPKIPCKILVPGVYSPLSFSTTSATTSVISLSFSTTSATTSVISLSFSTTSATTSVISLLFSTTSATTSVISLSFFTTSATTSVISLLFSITLVATLVLESSFVSGLLKDCSFGSCFSIEESFISLSVRNVPKILRLSSLK